MYVRICGDDSSYSVPLKSEQATHTTSVIIVLFVAMKHALTIQSHLIRLKLF